MSAADPSPGNRFAVFTPDDHGASLWITTLLALIYVSLTFFLRTYIKRRLLGWDDLALAAGTVLATGHYVAVIKALELGLGKSNNILGPLHLNDSAQATYASNVLAVLCLGVTKVSVLLLVQRIFAQDARLNIVACRIGMGLMVVWTLFCVVISAAGCSADNIYTEPAKCNQKLRWQIITALDVITEVLLVVLPLLMIWPLQMRIGQKAKVATAFLLRAPIIIISIGHLIAYTEYLNLRPGSPLGMVTAFIWLEIQIAYSQISATIPSMNAFLKVFNTANGGDIGSSGHYGTYGASGNYSSVQRGIQLASLRSQTDTQIEGGLGKNSKHLRPGADEIGHGRGHASHNKGSDSASIKSGSGSQDLIIRKEIQWEIRCD